MFVLNYVRSRTSNHPLANPSTLPPCRQPLVLLLTTASSQRLVRCRHKRCLNLAPHAFKDRCSSLATDFGGPSTGVSLLSSTLQNLLTHSVALSQNFVPYPFDRMTVLWAKVGLFYCGLNSLLLTNFCALASLIGLRRTPNKPPPTANLPSALPKLGSRPLSARRHLPLGARLLAGRRSARGARW